MSYNGCSCIAVRNALEYLGKTKPMADVVFFMERFRVLGGVFGCNVNKIGMALSHFGAEPIVDADLNSAQAFIVCIWTGKRFLSSVHTIFCVRESDGTITVYNRYNNSSLPAHYKTLDELTDGRKPVAAYVLKQRAVHNID